MLSRTNNSIPTGSKTMAIKALCSTSSTFSTPSTSSRLRYIHNMIFTFVLIIVLCSAISFSQYNSFSDSDIKLLLKKNPNLSDDNNLDLVEQIYDETEGGQIALQESKRKLENYTKVGSGFLPEKLWSLNCEPPLCPTEYDSPSLSDEENSSKQNNDDISLHLSGDKDPYKFLEWTMRQLGSVNSYNASGSYYTGLNMWKKGRRELPLYVEEPKYIVVRREPDEFEQTFTLDEDIPFIPPRGRKYSAYIEGIIHGKDSFIPHRGKKDRLKDILKYDELFFPHRGKKRTSSVVEGGGSTLREKNKLPTSSLYNNNYRLKAGGNDRQAFGDCFTPYCNDITTAAAVALSPHQQLVTNQAGNINALMPPMPSTFYLPSLRQALLANAAAVAQCQKENDVNINGFDQSVKAQQKRQRQHSAEGAFNKQQRNRRRLLSSSSSSASVEASASTFLPPQRKSSPSSSMSISQSDQLNRLQQYPIRNKQWRDYYVEEMAAQSGQFPPF